MTLDASGKLLACPVSRQLSSATECVTTALGMWEIPDAAFAGGDPSMSVLERLILPEIVHFLVTRQKPRFGTPVNNVSSRDVSNNS